MTPATPTSTSVGRGRAGSTGEGSTTWRRAAAALAPARRSDSPSAPTTAAPAPTASTPTSTERRDGCPFGRGAASPANAAGSCGSGSAATGVRRFSATNAEVATTAPTTDGRASSSVAPGRRERRAGGAESEQPERARCRATVTSREQPAPAASTTTATPSPREQGRLVVGAEEADRELLEPGGREVHDERAGRGKRRSGGVGDRGERDARPLRRGPRPRRRAARPPAGAAAAAGGWAPARRADGSARGGRRP